MAESKKEKVKKREKKLKERKKNIGEDKKATKEGRNNENHNYLYSLQHYFHSQAVVPHT